MKIGRARRFFIWPGAYLFISLGISSTAMGQESKESSPDVGSGAYNLMLRGLLDHSVPEIGVRELAETSRNYQLLDARAREEYAVSHLAGATRVGYEDWDEERVEELNRDDTVVVYCSVGYRSEKIAERLEALGFKAVYNLYGGLFEWVNQGYPLYREGKPTDQVHAYKRTWGWWLQRGDKVYQGPDE